MIEAAPRHIRRALVRRILQNYDIAHAFNRDIQPILFQRVEEAYEEWDRPDTDSIQQTSYAEVRGYLLNTLLRDSDVVSMAHSIELRPVLLDHEIAEFAYALPAHLKLNGAVKKYILKKAAADLLPNEILQRPKRGFELPQKTWMTTVLKNQILDLLNDNMARTLFSQDYIKQTSRLLRDGQARSELWAWSILMQWLMNTGIPLG
jgi:asparagine synthase (glutamine-hydrolysing)